MAHPFRSLPPRNGRYHLVAVDGRGGSGKTTLAAALRDRLPGFVLVNGDDYFEPLEDDERWGDFNDERFVRDVVEPLAAGRDINYRPYVWGEVPPIGERRIVVDAGVVLERCYAMAFDVPWDLTIWVETPSDVCLARGLARELLPRERVLHVWQHIWQPRESRYIADSDPAAHADLVVDGTRPFDDQIAALLGD